jgi:tRNA threonylcarbamoyladenosine biosynthesis protein TsaB
MAAASGAHRLQSRYDILILAPSMNVLAIETSTEFLSLAASRADSVVAHHVRAGQRHAELIMDSISALLDRAGLETGDLDGIAYGEGPGSFTGLRIACGVVQGLAFSRGVKVLGVSTLLALAEESETPRVLACIDARMGEVYHAAYVRAGDDWQLLQGPGLCGPDEVPVPEGAAWTGCGSGFAAFGETLQRRLGAVLATVRPAISPTATAVLRLAQRRFLRGEGGEAKDALPVYLRDRVALKTSER